MDQLESPAVEVWEERRRWFEEQEARRAERGSLAPSEQACALMIDLQSVFCAGAWAAVVILSATIAHSQLRRSPDNLAYLPPEDMRWLQGLRNALVHEHGEAPEFTIEDQWTRRERWEDSARRAVEIALDTIYPAARIEAKRAGA